MIKVLCVACPLGWPRLFIFKQETTMEQTTAIKKKILRYKGTYVSWVKTHVSITQHSKYSMRGTVKDPGIMICLSKMGCLTVVCSQMALMKQSLSLKNFIEINLAPSLKEK